MSSRAFLFVHGYEGSGPGHWQHWLAQELRGRGHRVAFPKLPAPEKPRVGEWLRGLARAWDELDEGRSGVTLICHSLGCWLADHVMARDAGRGKASGLQRALLVAPPSPFSLFEPIQDFLPLPLQSRAWAGIAGRSLVLGSDNDEYASEEDFRELAAKIGLPFRLWPGGGHLNAAAGFGAWPFALAWALGETPEAESKGPAGA